MRILDTTTRLVAAALDARARRHEVLASNVANADTPGYRARDLDAREATALRFVEAERRAEAAPELTLEGSVGARPAPVADPIVEMPGATPGLDGNTVDIDRTVTALAENAIEYAALARAVQKKLGMVRYLLSSEH